MDMNLLQRERNIERRGKIKKNIWIMIWVNIIDIGRERVGEGERKQYCLDHVMDKSLLTERERNRKYYLDHSMGKNLLTSPPGRNRLWNR